MCAADKRNNRAESILMPWAREPARKQLLTSCRAGTVHYQSGAGRLQLVVRLVVIIIVIVVGATAAAATLVVLLHDRGADALDLLLLLLGLLRVSLRVGREPVLAVLDRVEDLAIGLPRKSQA